MKLPWSPWAVADPTVRFDPAAIGSDIDGYLREREARVPDIRAGLEKEVLWLDPVARRTTPLAVVYVHGFSASKEELRPIPDDLAQALGANLFYTRLSGHGRPAAAMAEATANDWIDDVAEAIEIGRRIGDRVVMFGTSMGAALVAWIAAQPPPLSDRVAALVLVAPNLRAPALRYRWANTPLGYAAAIWWWGHHFGERNPDLRIDHAWTRPHPTRARFPTLAIAQLPFRSVLEAVRIPALCVYNPADRVGSPRANELLLQRWGGPKERVLVEGTSHPHVIAGRLLGPEKSDHVYAVIVDWLGRRGVRVSSEA